MNCLWWDNHLVCSQDPQAAEGVHPPTDSGSRKLVFIVYTCLCFLNIFITNIINRTVQRSLLQPGTGKTALRGEETKVYEWYCVWYSVAEIVTTVVLPRHKMTCRKEFCIESSPFLCLLHRGQNCWEDSCLHWRHHESSSRFFLITYQQGKKAEVRHREDCKWSTWGGGLGLLQREMVLSVPLPF